MEGSRHPALRVWLLLCGLAVLAACTTAAQRQAQQAVVASQEALAQFKACVKAVREKPEYSSLLVHTLDLDTGRPTMAQLTDETIPSEQDARLYAVRFDEANPCRGRFMTALSTARPDLVPIFSEAMLMADIVTAQLVERKITWAEAARRANTNLNDSRQKIAAAEQQWIATLNASHQAEMAQRQAAAAAILQWSAQQQMINAINRPPLPVYQMPVQQQMRLQTNCTTIGNITSCN